MVFLNEAYESNQLGDYRESPALLDFEPLALSENGRLQVIYRDQIIDYPPQVYVIDGQNVVPMGIVDFSDLLKDK